MQAYLSDMGCVEQIFPAGIHVNHEITTGAPSFSCSQGPNPDQLVAPGIPLNDALLSDLNSVQVVQAEVRCSPAGKFGLGMHHLLKRRIEGRIFRSPDCCKTLLQRLGPGLGVHQKVDTIAAAQTLQLPKTGLLEVVGLGAEQRGNAAGCRCHAKRYARYDKASWRWWYSVSSGAGCF